jgi:DNA-binding transcriptional LysR family regulator
MLRYLAEDEVDVAFAMLAGDPPDDLVVEQMSEDEIVAVFAPGAAPAKRSVRAADLQRDPIVAPRSGSAIKQALDDYFARAGMPLRVSLESGEPFLLRCMVAGGFGVSVLPRSLIRREGPPVEVRSFRPALRLPVALLWRRERHAPATARAFIEFARLQADRYRLGDAG